MSKHLKAVHTVGLVIGGVAAVLQDEAAALHITWLEGVDTGAGAGAGAGASAHLASEAVGVVISAQGAQPRSRNYRLLAGGAPLSKLAVGISH